VRRLWRKEAAVVTDRALRYSHQSHPAAGPENLQSHRSLETQRPPNG
jgi:hypothetical protein